MASVSFEIDDRSKYHQSHNEDAMLPFPEPVSDHSASSYFTLSEDVDSLWDDVSAMRRDMSVLTNGFEEYKEQSDDTMNYLIRKQQSESSRSEESIAKLTTEVSSLKVQMAILREKTMKNELMLNFLMQQAGEAAQQQFAKVLASEDVAQPMSDLSRQLDNIIESVDQ